MKTYPVIVGSYAYGLNIEQSDIDILQIGNYDKINSVPYILLHNIYYPINNFLEDITLTRSNDKNSIYVLFSIGQPEGPLKDYLTTHRENIVRANKIGLWNQLYSPLDKLESHFAEVYTYAPKRISYTIARYNILIQYARGVSCEEAMKLPEKLKMILLHIRKHRLPLNQVEEIYNYYKKQVDLIQCFYQEPTDDKYLIQIRQDVLQLLNNYFINEGGV